MIKTIWQKIKPILIIAGVMTVLILGMLLYTRNTERLPETPGVSLYLGWAEDTPGSYYHEMSRSGFFFFLTDEGIWHSQKDYEANYASDYNDWGDLSPNSMPPRPTTAESLLMSYPAPSSLSRMIRSR